MKKIFALFVFGMAMTAMVSFAQDAGGGKGKAGGDGKDGKRPVSPIVTVLDENSDGTIDAKEMADAPQDLKKLDKNNDGKLTADEFRPTRLGGAVEGDKKLEGDKKAGEGKDMKRPESPLVSALDTDKDGVIEDNEIAASVESLKKLDKNADGKLEGDEIRPARPEGLEGGKKHEGKKADKADAAAGK